MHQHPHWSEGEPRSREDCDKLVAGTVSCNKASEGEPRSREDCDLDDGGFPRALLWSEGEPRSREDCDFTISSNCSSMSLRPKGSLDQERIVTPRRTDGGSGGPRSEGEPRSREDCDYFAAGIKFQHPWSEGEPRSREDCDSVLWK